MNTLVVGATRSGKTLSRVRDIVEDVERSGRNLAIVCIDPHVDSLSWGVFKHLVARGYGDRILFDRLSNLDRVLSWRFLKPSTASNPLQRQSENELSARAFADVLSRRRGMDIARFILIEEWVMAVAQLYLCQNDLRGLSESDLPYAFLPGHPVFERMVANCEDALIAAKFQLLADGKVPRSNYAPAQRMIVAACHSTAFRARCGPSFDLPTFLSAGGILSIDGGAGRTVSEEAVQVMLGTVLSQTLHYARSRPETWPRLRIIVDEALNANLATAVEARACAEFQKGECHLDFLVQSPAFPASYYDVIVNNCRRHEWFFCASADVARTGAGDLGNPELQGELQHLPVGERYVKENGRVWREYVELLPEPWGYPQLTNLKALAALREIQQRPEYRDPLAAALQPNREIEASLEEPENDNLGI